VLRETTRRRRSALVGGRAVGDPAVFVSGGVMHQGPHGDGPVIAIVDVGA
jgi:barbiturase